MNFRWTNPRFIQSLLQAKKERRTKFRVAEAKEQGVVHAQTPIDGAAGEASTRSTRFVNQWISNQDFFWWYYGDKKWEYMMYQ